ncbi:MAG: hypothetical protein M3Y87_13860, partial [Myxococcota bacterium]|nr:hypothetical protein [Myxococcota bacterium]
MALAEARFSHPEANDMTTTVQQTGARERARRDSFPQLTRRGAWARDLAVLGGASALGIPLLLGASVGFAAITALAGALLGASIGAAVPVLLGRHVRRVPVVLLLGAGAGLGANWGA